MSRDDPFAPGHPSVHKDGWPHPNPNHLRRLTDHRGLWEHARYSSPRPEHGYCTEDNARALVVVSRDDGERLTDLATIYLGFVIAARERSGKFRNRRDADGVWTEEPGSDDSQGRAWWGLGATARYGPETWMRAAALDEFNTCSTFGSPHLRPNAYAALGAAAAIESGHAPQEVVDLLDRSSGMIADAARSNIPWPEWRLTYDNARIPEALIAAGFALGDERRTTLGIRLLEWLTDSESVGDRFSFTPVGGRGLGERGPDFDQQPIEAWATADACHRAWSVTGDTKWIRLALLSGAWLLGRNDSGTVLYDEATGSTFDGLTPNGANANQGAESTLAGLGTMQVAARIWAM
ncbi:MAG TPA: glycosyltransferase [Acidimicrobiia bacterium]|nr:glycosyltransferase [Acidimicrobiia bacterium]